MHNALSGEFPQNFVVFVSTVGRDYARLTFLPIFLPSEDRPRAKRNVNNDSKIDDERIAIPMYE